MSVIVELLRTPSVATAAAHGSPYHEPTASWPFAIIPARWGLCDLELEALRLALQVDSPAEPLRRHPPYAPAGETAFRAFLELRARYLDRDEAVPGPRFESLLRGAGGVFRSERSSQTEGVDGEWNATVAELLTDVEQLMQAIPDEDDTPAGSGESRRDASAYEQAVVLRHACHAALAFQASVSQ